MKQIRESRKKALNCLYLACPAPVADDVKAKVEAEIKELITRNAELEAQRDSWNRVARKCEEEKQTFKAENKRLVEALKEIIHELPHNAHIIHEILMKHKISLPKRKEKPEYTIPIVNGKLQLDQARSSAEGKEEEEMCECNRDHRKFGEKETGCCYFCGKNIKADGKEE